MLYYYHTWCLNHGAIDWKADYKYRDNGRDSLIYWVALSTPPNVKPNILAEKILYYYYYYYYMFGSNKQYF